LTFWRCFRTRLSITHRIGDDRIELEDKACLESHNHPEVYMELRIGTKKWFDFKTIKLIFWESMREFVKNSSDVKFNKEGEVEHADVGSYDIEEYTKELKSLLKANFAARGLKTMKMQIKIWETGKYGILDDGLC
jgi:hypothetical protein